VYFNTSSITLLTTINPKAREHIQKIENVCSSTKPFPNLDDSGQHKIYVISYWLQNRPFYSFKMKLAAMTRLQTAKLQANLQL
jgi:hypothetical protein